MLKCFYVWMIALIWTTIVYSGMKNNRLNENVQDQIKKKKLNKNIKYMMPINSKVWPKIIEMYWIRIFAKI